MSTDTMDRVERLSDEIRKAHTEQDAKPAAAFVDRYEPATTATAPLQPSASDTPMPSSLRRHLRGAEPVSLRTATDAELRNEWLLFTHAIDHVRPCIRQHAAEVDARRFEAAVERLRQSFKRTIQDHAEL
jgi:hypothetical protein